MEQSPMLSVPVAGGRQMEPLNWYFAAAACPVAVIVLFFLGGILPPSLLVFLFVYCLLIGPASLVIGIVESVRRRRGPVVHAEPRGMALYPSLIQVRVRRYSYTFGIAAGPISLIVEPALQVPIVHAIIHILCGFLLSAISFMLCVSNPWRPSCIHRGPFIVFSPDHMEIHPLADSSPTPIPWDLHPRIEGFTVEDYAFFPCMHMHVSVDGLEDNLVFDMTGAPMRFVLLRRLIDYFVDKPEERAKLGRPEGAQLVRSLLTAP